MQAINHVIKCFLVLFFFVSLAYADVIEDVKKREQQQDVLTKECEADTKGEVCIDLAKKHDLGLDDSENSNYLSVKLLKISCNKGNTKGCRTLKEFKINHENALDCYFDNETGEKCYKQGLIHQKLSKKSSSNEDVRYAKYFFKKACERNHKKGCDENEKLNSNLNDLASIYAEKSTSITLSMDDGKAIGILIRGEIRKGDYDEFISTVKRYKGELSSVFLDSQGGDAIEAMKIGRLIRELNLKTWAPMGSPEKPLCFGQNKSDKGKFCTCASSCFLIYMGGIKRYGDVLGIHRIYPKHEFLKNLSAIDAKKLHDSIKVEATKYLHEMGAPEELSNITLSIPSNKIKYLTKSEIEKFVPSVSPEYQEWLLAKCGDITALYNRQANWLKENKKKYKSISTLSEQNDKFPEYKKIEDEISKSNKCESSLFEKLQQESYLKKYGKS